MRMKDENVITESKYDKEVELRNWGFRQYDNGYTAPECRYTYLKGEVYNHPDDRFADGAIISTSNVLEIDADTKVVKCSSRSYKLVGKAHPEFLKMLTTEFLERVLDKDLLRFYRNALK